MIKQTFNVFQSLLFSYVHNFDVDSDKIACPCIDCNSGYAIVTTWNYKGVPMNTIVTFDPDELDEDEEGLCCINVDKHPLCSLGDYDTAFKYFVVFLSEKLSSIYSVGYSPDLLCFDVEKLLDGKVCFTGLVEG